MILKVLKTALVAPRYSRKRGCRASPGIDTFQTFLRESGFATASLGPGEKVDNVGEAVGLRPTQNGSNVDKVDMLRRAELQRVPAPTVGFASALIVM